MIQKDKLSHQQFLKTNKDYRKAASVAHLSYVNDAMPGISRLKKGKGFCYSYNGQLVKDENILQRIKKLAIPPSWSNVWICAIPHGHMQATGLDLNKRKQYRYHNDWSVIRNETKFHRLYEFGKALPLLRQNAEKDINNKELSENKVLAAAIRLMEQTYIRVGNNDYEKMYGSYGLTTLKDEHVNIKKDKLYFSFTGKKGIEHSISLKNKKLARIIKQCKDIPGKKLFQYYDAQGNKKHIDSGTLNNYIKKATGMDFSAKDFRTWAGSLQAILSFRAIGNSTNVAETKRNIICMLDTVSSKLGNSPNICKKYYIHPGLISLYEKDKLFNYISKCTSGKKNLAAGLSSEEQILLALLKKCF